MSSSAYRKAVIGLGNPGLQYHWTRHNLGFLAVDHFISNFASKGQKLSAKFSQLYGFKEYLIAKPQTFMNRSGLAAAEICAGFGISPESLCVIYDDYALPFGTIRARKQGGAGGHNGMKSLIEILGTDQFSRLRLGIGDESQRDELVGYVLDSFSKEQERALDGFLDRAAEAIDCFLNHGIEATMNRFNT